VKAANESAVCWSRDRGSGRGGSLLPTLRRRRHVCGIPWKVTGRVAIRRAKFTPGIWRGNATVRIGKGVGMLRRR